MQSAFGLQLFNHAGVQIAQMGHITQRVVQLFGGQRPAAPIGEARAFVQIQAQTAFDQRHVADAVAKAQSHSGDLRVKKRRGDIIAKGVEYFHVLTGSMHNLGNGRLHQQV